MTHHPFFPHQAKGIYLNHAAISPLSTPVVQALTQCIEERHQEHIENFFNFQTVLSETKKQFARLLHTDPSNLAYVPNTSSGFNILVNGFDWKEGDRILLNTLEFPSNIYPFMNCESLGVKIDYVQAQDHYLSLDDFEQALTPNTRCLSISHVQFLTGQRMDLKALGKLCKNNGTYFSVDGIQSLGASSIDVEECGIDFLSCGSHKWLMAPTGLGLIYVSPRLQAQLKSSIVGWLSVKNEWDLLNYDLSLKDDASRFETGTMNLMAVAGLNASLKLFESEGTAKVESKILALSGYLHEALSEAKFKVLTPKKAEERLGIVSIQLENADEIYHDLKSRKIEVAVREGKYLRISPHFYNTQAELEQVLKALTQFKQG